MRVTFSILIFLISASAFAQFRSTNGQAFGSLIVPALVSEECTIGHTTNGFVIRSGDATNPQNSLIQGTTVCRLMGIVNPGGTLVALPGGNWRNTTDDIDPATAPCRFEGTVSATTLTPMTCGVDP